MRTLARKLVYATPLRRLLPENATNRDPKWWDAELSGPRAAYLGGTLSIDMRNSATADLIKHHARPNPTVLDVGCAGGTLALTLPTFTRYVGIDLSEVAIAHACKTVQSERASFEAADLAQYEPTALCDVIVFNEVLYYLGVDVAVQQVERYASVIGDDGIIIVSMKDDPKARAIMAKVANRLSCLGSILFQATVDGVSYSIRSDRERPAYVVAAFRRS